MLNIKAEENEEFEQNVSSISLGVNEDTGIVEVFIRGVILSPAHYSRELTMLRDLSSTYSTVQITVNTPGGDVSTTIELLSILDQFETFIAVGTGIVMSAGFLLWASADIRTLTPYTSLMIHRELYNYSGQTQSHLDFANHNEKIYSTMYEEYVVSGMITREEYEKSRMANVYLDCETMIDRGFCISYEEFLSKDPSGLQVNVVRTVNIHGVTFEFVGDSVSLVTIQGSDSGQVYNALEVFYNGIPIEFEEDKIHENSVSIGRGFEG